MPKVVTASAGDTLCGIGIDNGFLDCGPIRAANAGQEFLTRPLQDGDQVTVPDLATTTESKSTTTTAPFVKKNAPPVSIRFVHGSPDKAYTEDDTLLFLLVSKFQVDKGGATGASAFPGQFEFQQAGHADLAAFKVEIVDPAAGGTVQATLEALKPVYKPDKTVDHNELFTGAEYDKRKLDVQCAKVRSGVAYRSKYLRLVVDEADKDGTVGPVAANGFAPGPGSPKPDQSLLVTDMVDQNEPDVEILDQRVRATYTITRCPGSPQCCVTAELPLGDDRQRLRLFVHVMRRTPGGAPVVTLDNARRRVLKWCRRIFAQSSIAPEIVGIQEEDPVENMIMISDPGVPPPVPGANAGGSSASGVDSSGRPSQIQFRIRAADGTEQLVGPITPVDPAAGTGFTPIQTANALAALVQAPFTATATENPRRSNDTQGSADIVIRHNAGQFVTFGVASSSDTAQTLDVGNINPLPAPQASWDGFNFLAGSPDQRVMLKNYDTGADRIDVFVVDSTSDGNRGEAMIHGHAITTDATRWAIDCVKSSLFVIQSTMDSTDSDPLVLSHEAGHVTGEVGHAQGVPTELMSARVTGNNAVGSSKRLTSRAVPYDLTSGGSYDINQRMRSEGGAVGLLDPW